MIVPVFLNDSFDMKLPKIVMAREVFGPECLNESEQVLANLMKWEVQDLSFHRAIPIAPAITAAAPRT